MLPQRLPCKEALDACRQQARYHLPQRVYRSCPNLSRSNTRSNATDGGDTGTSTSTNGKKDLGAGLKAAWYGAEVFGDFISKTKGSQDKSSPQSSSSSSVSKDTMSHKMTVDEVIASIKEDYATDYFISGEGEMAAYDPNCLFADPFVSFRGVERFKKNVSNLGGLIRDVKLEITKIDQREGEVEAFWKFSCILDLPWQPLLAAAGSTTHVIDSERGLVVEHIEAWKSDPKEVVSRLLRPAAKVPRNAWETFMMSASAGDVKGCWLAVSGRVALVSAPVAGAAMVVHLITGHGLPVVVGGSVTEVLATSLLVGGLVTEVFKFAQGMQGGETGTGGRF